MLSNVETYSPPCRFLLGFQILHDQLATVVGDCTGEEQHDPANGDGLQTTTHGLLVWRKFDNRTAFTDGYLTWVDGPYGVQERLNTERFPWEASGLVDKERCILAAFDRDAEDDGSVGHGVAAGQ
ncbi:MAG TPA: hypothetical protein VIU62_15575 [Chloroflexota bacterium]